MTTPTPLPHGPRGTIRVVCAASSLGAPQPGPAAAPEALLAAGLLRRLNAHGAPAEADPLLRPFEAPPHGAPMAERLEAAGIYLRRLADHVAALPQDCLPLILGGDHSVAAGTWRGVARRVQPRGTLGLIWIDAHLDSHTDLSTHSGNIHGMPLAALLGEGHEALTGVPGPRPDPNRVCLIGARAWEAEELQRLTRLGARVFTMAEVHRRGLAAVFREALEIVRDGTAGFGVSVDLDAVDPLDMPAVLCPEPDGLRAAELADALHALRACGDLAALEIVEYVPERDPRGESAIRAMRCAEAALGAGTYLLRTREREFGAHNYAPPPVVFQRGVGVWLWDVEGRRYLDMMAAYSALAFGHAHPRLLGALTEQAGRLALTSRAYANDRLPMLLERLCVVFGYQRALPVNTGLEAVETALKAARKWAYQVKGVPAGTAEIIACQGNFHGRSIAIVGLSSEARYRQGFGPFPPGLRCIPYGDPQALEEAITPHTAAFLVEPLQAEGGMIVPPSGYLARCAEICARHNVLLIADEVQTGLGRTGRLLGCDHDGVRPDGLILGKALGGGLLPVSAFLADAAVMDVFQPGDHGSTFGGNPLGAAVALEVLDLLAETRIWEHAERLGAELRRRLAASQAPCVREIRGRGLLTGIELAADGPSAARAAELLLTRGIATRDARGNVLRLSPPLIIDDAVLAQAADTVGEVLGILSATH
ncbi:ornithine--oxo-acid transaminase [Pseudothauera nasutitermitis]|uniref:Ornithine--oxo-acid aminotransferase n=1 Tax=Pseudothauera nasutitermitis TaxID=2565930 RepID=A0A4S4AVJ5_9RHOO|nr:ornithine--oxo-acid transaminase [Pseudothauera nasutitermitis]THF64047.1 ornithine--oxo-acid transaminase [Pseudothauera nasutitermitis]